MAGPNWSGVSTNLIPSEEPWRAGFSTNGKPSCSASWSRLSAAPNSEKASRLNECHSGVSSPCACISCLNECLSRQRPEAWTSEPVYGTPRISSRSWSVPSSPPRPCIATKTKSGSSSRMRRTKRASGSITVTSYPSAPSASAARPPERRLTSRSRLRPPLATTTLPGIALAPLVLGDQDRLERARGGAALGGLGERDVEQGVGQLGERDAGRLEQVEGERARHGVRLVQDHLGRAALGILQEEVVSDDSEEAEPGVRRLRRGHERVARGVGDRRRDDPVGARHPLRAALLGAAARALRLPALAPAAQVLVLEGESGLGIANGLLDLRGAEAGPAAAQDGHVHLQVVVERGLDQRGQVELEGQLERLLELIGARHARHPDGRAERDGLHVAREPLLAGAPERFRAVARPLLAMDGGVRAHLHAGLFEHELAEPLVHRDRRRSDAAAHVRQAAQLERAEEAAVLAARAVDRVDGGVHLQVPVALEAGASR